MTHTGKADVQLQLNDNSCLPANQVDETIKTLCFCIVFLDSGANRYNGCLFSQAWSFNKARFVCSLSTVDSTVLIIQSACKEQWQWLRDVSVRHSHKYIFRVWKDSVSLWSLFALFIWVITLRYEHLLAVYRLSVQHASNQGSDTLLREAWISTPVSCQLQQFAGATAACKEAQTHRYSYSVQFGAYQIHQSCCCTCRAQTAAKFHVKQLHLQQVWW